jgi:ABC-2 type transport system ATP-binding protein
MPAIEVHELTRTFSDLTAVDHISFEIEEGETFGLLGPNGAGKTTTISMLSTLLEPSSGQAWVNGMDIAQQQDGVRKSIGIVFQDQSLDEELTAFENMDFHARLYRIEKQDRSQKILDLLNLVGLEQRKDDLVKTFSGGMRRRLEIARGLLHEPKVLFLDEPTLGLDPQTRNHLWHYIDRLNREKGITIILTTHYMEEADRLCRRVAIIDQGKIIAMDTPSRLKEQIGGEVITVRSSDPDAVCRIIRAPWVHHAEQHEDSVTISVQNAEEHITELVTMLTAHRVPIQSISLRKPTLEDVFLHFTGRTIREEEAGAKDTMRMIHRAYARR